MQKTQTFFENEWHTGNVKLFGAEEKSSWLGMSVFDGARSFDGVQPDLDIHCKRSIKSANVLGMNPTIAFDEIMEIAQDGISRFDPGTHLYIRIEFWDQGGLRGINPSGGIGFAVIISEAPLIRKGFTANLSKFIRPGPEQAPTDAKASCLYPNSLMAVVAAHKEGFDNAVTLDPYGNVAEFTLSNIFMVKNNVVYTPIPNRTFLNGVTRQRIIKLLRNDGYDVIEKTIHPDELDFADEIFSTGNASKVQSVIQYKDRILGEGPITQRAWDLYLEFAHKQNT